MSATYLREADHLALAVLDTGKLPLASRQLDLQAVHAWSNEQFGVVLLTAQTAYRGLWSVTAERVAMEPWEARSGGGNLLVPGEHRESELGGAVPEPALNGYALRQLGGGRHGILRYAEGVAAADVAVIRLVNDQAVSEVPMATSRYFVLGATHRQPVTHAVPLDFSGREIPGSRLTL